MAEHKYADVTWDPLDSKWSAIIDGLENLERSIDLQIGVLAADISEATKKVSALSDDVDKQIRVLLDQIEALDTDWGRRFDTCLHKALWWKHKYEVLVVEAKIDIADQITAYGSLDP